MTQKDFYSYLLDFFFPADVMKLEEYALECVRDVSEGIPESEKFTDDDGRDHVIEMIQCGDLNFDDLERIIERPITEEERKKLEWMF